ncbi:hypothetical protein AALP_AAs71531U000200 [Arabis alpina]|uniref:Uncharacterized protein n=1 Tax=Arabis alpina TaxID=50452 RepID=A0A087G3G3_ARAAL|nr:hypothetical protein AALP_AAs71531U000200 [Arabis alpina]
MTSLSPSHHYRKKKRSFRLLRTQIRVFFSIAGSSPPEKQLNSGQPNSHQHHRWVFPFSDQGHESHDPFLTPSETAINNENEDNLFFFKNHHRLSLLHKPQSFESQHI